MTVRFEHRNRVTIVTIDRPEVRNAVDGETSAALVAAFRAFDTDDGRDVAVLTGAGGTFCSGADLKAITGRRAKAVTDATARAPTRPRGRSDGRARTSTRRRGGRTAAGAR